MTLTFDHTGLKDITKLMTSINIAGNDN